MTNKNITDTNQTVTLTASYTSGGVTLTASKSITLTNRFLVSIVIAGDNVVSSGVASSFVCMATWSDGATTAVTPTWALSSNQYASMEADGKLTNKNATDNDQTVTLTADFASGGVTKTASKVVTLAKRTLTDVAINGDEIVANFGSSTYVCTAIWSVGEPTEVTALWRLSSNEYAAIDGNGKVTNKNTTDTDQSVTLTASFTHDGVTKTANKAITLEKRYLASIAIEGNSIIPNGGTATYSCTATWSDGATTKVSPTWSISTTTFATVDAAGNVLNTNATDRDQPMTLTAVCQAGDVTKTATMTVTLAKRVFSSVTIEGDGAISAGNAVNYVCLANWSVGEPTVVTASWSVSSTAHATVDTAGKVTNRNTTEADQTVTLTASHTIDGVTKTGAKTIMLTKRILLDLAINGVATVGSGESASYLCEASWSDGATTAVKATWSLDSTEFASVDANGRVKNMNTTADDQTVTLNVTFTSGGETKTESKVLTLVKRTLADLAIVGDSAIANGLTSAYECKATWSDGTTSLVTLLWIRLAV